MNVNITKTCLLFLLTICMLPVMAQRKAITGLVTDSLSAAPLAGVQVTNLTTNKKATANTNGQFTIGADVNDVLYFTKDGYRFKTFAYSLLMDGTLDVKMSPLANVLPGVSVRADYNKYQSDSIKRLDDFNKDMVSPKYKAVQNNSNGAGAVINLDRLSSREKQKRRADKLFKQHEEEAYIRYRFSPDLVSEYTGLKGDSLERFINNYRPGYDWLRKHTTEEDVFYYINDKLKDYYRRKE
ncbi:carboxypeptidase regulatory-like domain-containing protein [Panacibacter sp. DH6]|uniref:Carboxypeptidase regulatory-like domain-containing protein n=1 Tax=Panacibacter microcysteis TaxID=2793269 RepID=A0A931GZR6_9BACT|nr:carboxypeptidase-like regulatory domain-containing protein [Panacibacter microcysteis]MBG9378340.1 carboxypeptidase regulatory-like domain-containing protein [Panacibacter microcysteis]